MTGNTVPKDVCDLVLKGGITSGVVYPRLVARLAEQYRFKSIGGTSAGAIAAAACAAAELARRNGSGAGFDALRTLPDELGEKVGKRGESRLHELFQPSPRLRAHFRVLVGMLHAPDGFVRTMRGVRAAVRQFPGIAVLGVLVTAALLFLPAIAATEAEWPAALAVAGATTLAWAGAAALLAFAPRIGPLAKPLARVLLAVVLGLAAAGAAVLFAGGVLWHAFAFALVAAAIVAMAFAGTTALLALRFGVTLVNGLHANCYGICGGRTERHARHEALTDWLHAYLKRLAGKADSARPLCFGDLWGQPLDLDGVRDGDRDLPPEQRAIQLEVMTTAVSQQLCYGIPFRENAGDFFFEEAVWRRLFPDDVVDWLVAAAGAEDRARVAAGRQAPLEVVAHGAKPARVLRRLPANRFLPVVVAVRMSLAFPVLLAAVPLYAVDFSLTENAEARRTNARLQATRVWFSDGGISSNMPLHFFDAPIPGHPTFAVNLKGEHPAYPVDARRKACEQEGRVYLPSNNSQGTVRYWEQPDDSSPAGLVGFLSSIVGTMQSWRDEIQFPYPGFRDRIVQISQLPTEGGMNLDMPKESIEALADAGECAAQRLIDRFHPQSTAPQRGGWENHKEVRLKTFLGVLERMALSVHRRLGDPEWLPVLRDLEQRGVYPAQVTPVAVECLEKLRALGAVLEPGGALEKAAPRPHATMRIAPRI